MTGFERFTDVLGVALATLAIGLSLLTVVQQRRHQRRDTYRQIYETLMSDSLHRGRWMINEVGQAGALPDDPEDLRLIYRTLGTFDNVAMYVRYGVVPRDWVLEVWHHPLRELRTGAERVRAAQRSDLTASSGLVAWPQLWELFEAAEDYCSEMPCCGPPPAAGPGTAAGRPASAPKG
jgi:hypothetical protein